MMTTGTAISEVIGVILKSELPHSITGAVARRRPINSDKEDIVVNSLPVTFTQLQRCLINVNIYVPNIDFTANGVTDTEYPNYPRLEELAGIAVPILKRYIGKGFYLQFQQENIAVEPRSSYVNIRLMARAKNL